LNLVDTLIQCLLDQGIQPPLHADYFWMPVCILETRSVEVTLQQSDRLLHIVGQFAVCDPRRWIVINWHSCQFDRTEQVNDCLRRWSR